MSIFPVAPNLTNTLGFWKRLPLVENSSSGMPHAGRVGMFRVYIPSNFGGILEIGTDDPKRKISIHYPKPDSDRVKDRADKEHTLDAMVKYHVPKGQHGWHYVYIGGPHATAYRVHAMFREVGLAGIEKGKDADPLVPWNFWYFPYSDKANEKFTAWSTKSHLEPCQRYEKAFGKAGVFQWEIDQHHTPFIGDASWVGHCHNSAPASMIFEIPPDAGKDHNGEKFTCEELKFFATEFFGLYGQLDYVWGLPGTGSMGRNGPYQEKRPNDDPALFGKQVIPLIDALRKALLEERLPALVDMRNSNGTEHSEVWNQAVYKYEAWMWETTPHGDWQDIQMKTVLYANEDIMPAGAISSGAPAEIIADGPKSGGVPKDTKPHPKNAQRNEELLFHVFFDNDGKLKKSSKTRWLSTTIRGKSALLHAPRFMFTPKKPATTPISKGDGNPMIDRADILSLLPLRSRFK